MSTTILTPQPSMTPRPNIVVEDKMIIPGWVCDHESYRDWAKSDAYPQSGLVSFLDGDIYVDLTMEEFFTHNQVKQAFNVGIGTVLLRNPTGRFVPDRMLFTNISASVTTEPDGLYAHWTTMKSGRLRLVAGKTTGYTELEGTADMVLEIISQYSERKDTVRLRALYEKARIPEYWLVDARGDTVRFDILRLVDDAYQSIASHEGWIPSEVFGCSFRLVREIDPLGQPAFQLQVNA